MNFSFSKTFRLRKRQEFQFIQKNSDKWEGKWVFLQKVPSSSCFQFGITVSRRFGNAVRRNRFKRIVREAFRLFPQPLPPLKVIIHPRFQAKYAKSQDILDDLNIFFKSYKENELLV